MEQRSNTTLPPKILPPLAIPVVLAAIQAAASLPAQARPAWASGTFVYADVCTVPETGGRAGQRIVLRRSPNGDALFYEAASGAAPVPAGTVTLDSESRSLDFVAGPLSFHGTLARDALSGTLEDESGPHIIHLKRVLRSHAHEHCTGETTESLGAPR